MCDFTEMNPYIAELRAQTATPSPATAAVPLCSDGHPLDLAVAGDLHMEIPV